LGIATVAEGLSELHKENLGLFFLGLTTLLVFFFSGAVVLLYSSKVLKLIIIKFANLGQIENRGDDVEFWTPKT